ncbi:MAG: hypothetical protein C4538_04655 [Nitrospiraceae bacterium]|nr:MAG: hypothetical protein C4538_04655 [Nitrospiraceae bacterium]
MNANRLIIISAFLMTLSLLILLSEGHLWKHYETVKIKEFQRYTGGLGLGASVSPEWGFISYDMRIDYTDETNLWPIPGGYSYAPDKNASVAGTYELTAK